MTSTKNRINYGTVEIDDSFLDPKNHKVRVTTFIDGDVVQWLKSEAAHMGIGYQTLLNMKLKEGMNGPSVKEAMKEAMYELFEDGKLVLTDRKGRAQIKGAGKPPLPASNKAKVSGKRKSG
jgi:uncharacterized protein (DUF4415 family)